jgi:hypothetical protein
MRFLWRCPDDAGSHRPSSAAAVVAALAELIAAKLERPLLAKADWVAFGPSAEHETKCIFFRYRLDLTKNMHYCACH